jgi:hypothetical protein
MNAIYYNGTGAATTGLPGIANWVNALADNGGPTRTCLLKYYNGSNPAAGVGNPAYAGLPDQRGVIRANPPCVGAIDVPYGRPSDILINDTTIYMGSSVTLTAHSATVSNPVFLWFSDAGLNSYVHTGASYTTPVLNSNYYYYLTVHNSTVLPNPPALAKRVIIYVVQKPIIIQQPADALICINDSAFFSVGSYGPGLSYQWVKNNIDLPGQTDTTLKLTNIQYADSGYIFCKVTNSFGTTYSDTVQLMVHTIPGAGSAINGLTNVCPGVNNALYVTPAIADANTYTWSLPGNTTGTSNTDSIYVSFSDTAQSGNITVYGNNQCGSGTPVSLYITIGNYAPSAAGAITGNNNVCKGQNNVTYSIPPVPNANSYVWTLPNGATGTSTTNSITVNYGLTAVSGNVTVKGTNSCGDGAASTLSIAVNSSLPVSVTIAANPGDTICVGTNVTFTATPVNGGSLPTYQWTKNGNNIPGATNATYSSTSLLNGDVIRCVLTTNGEPCLTGSPATSNTIPMIVYSYPATPVISIVGANLHSSAAAGNQMYRNNVPIPGATGQNYSYVQNGNYYVIVTINDCASDTSNIINIVNVGIENAGNSIAIAIYPNPAKDHIIIESSVLSNDVVISVYSVQGLLLLKQNMMKVKTELDIRSYAEGVYFVKIGNAEGFVVKKFIKE